MRIWINPGGCKRQEISLFQSVILSTYVRSRPFHCCEKAARSPSQRRHLNMARAAIRQRVGRDTGRAPSRPLRGVESTDLEPRDARDGAESKGASSSHVGSADLPFWAPPNDQTPRSV